MGAVACPEAHLLPQRLLLQDLHDSHVCNSLLVAESEEDLWRSETLFHSRQRAPMPSDGERTPQTPASLTRAVPSMSQCLGEKPETVTVPTWSWSPGTQGERGGWHWPGSPAAAGSGVTSSGTAAQTGWQERQGPSQASQVWREDSRLA